MLETRWEKERVKVVPLTQLLPTAKEWATKICEKAPPGVQRAIEALFLPTLGRDETDALTGHIGSFSFNE